MIRALSVNRPGRKGIFLLAIGAAIASLSGCLGDGDTLVGPASNEFHPGVVYTTALSSAGPACFWIGMTDASGRPGTWRGGGAFLDGNAGRLFMQTAPGATIIQSQGCGTWTPAKATSYNADRTQARPGMHRVPADLVPGTYTAAPARKDRTCVFARLPNLYGGSYFPIATGVNSPWSVTIKSTDVGFLTYDCTTWHRIGP